MAIPKYDEITLPLLKIMADGKVRAKNDLHPLIADAFNLTPEERTARLPSGQSTYLKNRTGWADFHLRKAGLLDLVNTSDLRITEAGQKFLATNPPPITRAVLMQFEPFRTYIEQLKKDRAKAAIDTGEPSLPRDGVSSSEDGEGTPQEIIDENHRLLRAQLASELLQSVKQASPAFFEQLVVDLLLAMGYGGSRAEAGRATKLSGDGGIDGVIDEDRLGLDAIYLQAKRWEGSVGEPQLRDFVGALHAKGANKGVFLTTGDFSDPAQRYVEKITNFKIKLIDGKKLTELMIDFNIGVSRAHTYEIKKIDSDYFTEE